MNQPTAPTAARAPKSLGPCACRFFEFGEFDGENEDAISYDTDCAESTKRTFAQGHDAKLVGFLVRAEMAGEEIRMVQGGVAITFDGATDAAGRISEALAEKAAKMLASRVAKAQAKANKAPRAPRKAKPVEVPAEIVPVDPPVEMEPVVEQAEQNTAFSTTRQATIKVGRWSYDATIDFTTGDATYRGKLRGEDKVAKAGTFTEVN